MICVHVQYFAILRDLTKKDEEDRSTEAVTAKELYEEVSHEFGFQFDVENLRVAVNDTFSEWDYELKEGDKIVFIPPVSGG